MTFVWLAMFCAKVAWCIGALNEFAIYSHVRSKSGFKHERNGVQKANENQTRACTVLMVSLDNLAFKTAQNSRNGGFKRKTVIEDDC